MKKIIGGKTYNTDTARQVAAGDNGLYTNDMHYASSTLYQTKKGTFFVKLSNDLFLVKDQNIVGTHNYESCIYTIQNWFEYWDISVYEPDCGREKWLSELSIEDAETFGIVEG